MAKFHEFTFLSADGIHDCYACRWLPDEGEPKGVVQIVHGVSEHVSRYDHLARFLADHGYAVFGEDHLGHGKTAEKDGSFGFFARRGGWELVLEDVHRLFRLAREQYPGLTYTMLGHSMGSFLTRHHLCKYPLTADCAVLSGTGQEPAALVALGRGIAAVLAAVKGPEKVSPLVHQLSLGAYNKQFKPNRTTADWISRDEAAVDVYLQDEFCSHMPTVGLYRDMLGGLQYIASEKALFRMSPETPVYIFSGDKDPVGSNGAGVEKVYGFFRDHGTRDLTMKLYPGGRHEMHNELNRDEVYADLLKWLDEHSKR